jgi:hypothetical protein
MPCTEKQLDVLIHTARAPASFSAGAALSRHPWRSPQRKFRPGRRASENRLGRLGVSP